MMKQPDLGLKIRSFNLTVLILLRLKLAENYPAEIEAGNTN